MFDTTEALRLADAAHKALDKLPEDWRVELVKGSYQRPALVMSGDKVLAECKGNQLEPEAMSIREAERVAEFAVYARNNVPALATSLREAVAEIARLREGPTVVEMGHGRISVNWGCYYEVPAVFLEPLDHAGEVGQPVEPPRPKDSINPGSVVITFANTAAIDVLIEDLNKARALLGGDHGHD